MHICMYRKIHWERSHLDLYETVKTKLFFITNIKNDSFLYVVVINDVQNKFLPSYAKIEKQ